MSAAELELNGAAQFQSVSWRGRKRPELSPTARQGSNSPKSGISSGRCEEHARETEARAQSLCASALERLRLAEMRAEAAERVQRELTITAEHRLQGACRALEQAQSCIEAQKDKLTAAELRAEVAEAEARQAKEALALVEEAIRKRLLCANPDADSRLTAVA